MAVGSKETEEFLGELIHYGFSQDDINIGSSFTNIALFDGDYIVEFYLITQCDNSAASCEDGCNNISLYS